MLGLLSQQTPRASLQVPFTLTSEVSWTSAAIRVQREVGLGRRHCSMLMFPIPCLESGVRLYLRLGAFHDADGQLSEPTHIQSLNFCSTPSYDERALAADHLYALDEHVITTPRAFPLECHHNIKRYDGGSARPCENSLQDEHIATVVYTCTRQELGGISVVYDPPVDLSDFKSLHQLRTAMHHHP